MRRAPAEPGSSILTLSLHPRQTSARPEASASAGARELSRPMPLGCAEARVAWSGLLKPGSGALGSEGLSRHFSECPTCHADYSEDVKAWSEYARSRRSEPEPQLLLDSGASRGTRSRLRVLIYPALLIVFLLQLGSLEERQASLRPQVLQRDSGGEPTGSVRAAKAGDLFVIGAGQRLEVRLEAASLQVAGPARLLVESDLPARLRLQSGEAALTGTLELWTPSGLLTLTEGSAHLGVSSDHLQGRCLSGQATLHGPDGLRSFGVGDSFGQ